MVMLEFKNDLECLGARVKTKEGWKPVENQMARLVGKTGQAIKRWKNLKKGEDNFILQALWAAEIEKG